MTDNLNDEFEKEVEGNLNDLMEEPNTNPDQPNPDEIVMAGSDEPTPVPNKEDLFGVGVVNNEVPNLNATFTDIDQRVNQVQDYYSVAQPVINAPAGKCTVCQEDIKTLVSIIPSVVNEDRPIGMFTGQRTRTMADETAQIALNTVDKNLAEITESTLGLARKIDEIFTPIIQNIEDRSYQAAIDQSREMTELIDKIDFTERLYLFAGVTLRKLMTGCIKRISYIDDLYESNNPVAKAFLEVVENIKASHEVCGYIRSTKKESNEFIVPIGRALYKLADITDEETLSPVLIAVDNGIHHDDEEYVNFEDVSHAVTSHEYREYVKTLTGVLLTLLTRVKLIEKTLSTSSNSADIEIQEQIKNASRLNSQLHEFMDQMMAITTFINDSYILGQSVVALYESIVKVYEQNKSYAQEHMTVKGIQVLSKPFPDEVDPTDPPEDKILSNTPLVASKSMSVTSAVLAASMGPEGASYGYAE